mmetsp:Transcript_75680/g.175482  ORF Transcript_75680/g.175482 Transcript_75680/m.175482 type:complete len:222 (-) Transcript_75680:504-1169(-)
MRSKGPEVARGPGTGRPCSVATTRSTRARWGNTATSSTKRAPHRCQREPCQPKHATRRCFASTSLLGAAGTAVHAPTPTESRSCNLGVVVRQCRLPRRKHRRRPLLLTAEVKATGLKRRKLPPLPSLTSQWSCSVRPRWSSWLFATSRPRRAGARSPSRRRSPRRVTISFRSWPQMALSAYPPGQLSNSSKPWRPRKGAKMVTAGCFLGWRAAMRSTFLPT